MAIIDAVEDITNALEKKKPVAGIFIGVQKVFDTVNHCILLQKIERYGIRGVAWNWIKSYFTERQRFVPMDEHESKRMTIVCGLLQGPHWGLYYLICT